MLRTRIMSGLPAGSVFREEAVAAELGVSRNTLREALKLLAAEGLVNLERNRGASVASVPSERVCEIYAIRRMLEPQAISASLRAAEAKLAKLDAAVEACESAAREERWVDVGTHSLTFHQELLGLLDNKLLDSFIEGLSAQLRLAWGEARDEAAFQRPWSTRDRELLDQIRSGSVEKACELLQSYLDDAERQTLAAIRLNHTFRRREDTK